MLSLRAKEDIMPAQSKAERMSRTAKRQESSTSSLFSMRSLRPSTQTDSEYELDPGRGPLFYES